MQCAMIHRDMSIVRRFAHAFVNRLTERPLKRIQEFDVSDSRNHRERFTRAADRSSEFHVSRLQKHHVARDNFVVPHVVHNRIILALNAQQDLISHRTDPGRPEGILRRWIVATRRNSLEPSRQILFASSFQRGWCGSPEAAEPPCS